MRRRLRGGRFGGTRRRRRVEDSRRKRLARHYRGSDFLDLIVRDFAVLLDINGLADGPPTGGAHQQFHPRDRLRRKRPFGLRRDQQRSVFARDRFGLPYDSLAPCLLGARQTSLAPADVIPRQNLLVMLPPGFTVHGALLP